MALPARRPLWCLVTDRRRLGCGDGPDWAALIGLVGAAAHAGVDLVQVREPDLDARGLADLVRACLMVARGSSARILVNDRADVALACGAHGVHLRGDSMPASRLRPIVPSGFLVGRSVHSTTEALAAVEDGGLDYVMAGTVLPTRSKSTVHDYLGLEGLRFLTRRVGVPVLAIGGVSRGTAAAVLGTGVAGVAAIGLFCDLGADAGGMAAWLESLSGPFDTPRSVS